MDSRDNWDMHWECANEDSSTRNPSQVYRIRLIVQQLKNKIKKPVARIFDIGSGKGDLIAELASLFPASQFYGMELSSKGVEISRKKVPSAHFTKMDLMEQAGEIPEDLKCSADVAICSEVLEHVDDPLLFLNNTGKLLKKDAVLIVTVPGGPRTVYDRYLGHRKHFKERDLRELLENAGYEVNSILRAGFPFFNLYKILVILRGKRLIADTTQKQMPLLARLVMRCFTVLFRISLNKSPWGWQLVAVAKYKHAKS